MKHFQEQSENIVVKLRFYGTHGGQDSLNLATGDQGGELSFKRKSAKQTLRDRERAVENVISVTNEYEYVAGNTT